MKAINDLIDKVYLINLATRPDRLQRVKERLECLDIKYERLEAIDGKTIEPHHHLKPGEVGCNMSHVSALRDAKRNNYGSILILEDDVVFKEDILERFNEGYKRVPDDWEIIFLGGDHIRPPTKISEHIVKCNFTFNTHAYIIRDVAYEKLLAKAKRMSAQIDTVYARMQILGKVKAYGFYPWLANQEDGYSDVQDRDINYTQDFGKFKRNFLR
tara:strand:+ start:234 stop:875 length:642 start_codon:yes stop_codon:yes gene_type:complete